MKIENIKKKLPKAQKDRYRCEHNRISWLVGNACPKCKRLKVYKQFMDMTEPPAVAIPKEILDDGKDELIKNQDEYIKFLSKHISDHAVYLHIHGFRVPESKVKKGQKFRDKISELKKEIYG